MKKTRFLLLLGIPLLLLDLSDAAARGGVKGKVFFSKTPIKDRSLKAVTKKFAKEKPTIELKRNKDKSWEVTMVAIFKRKAHPGPITLWFYDKSDKAAIKAKQTVHEVSIDSQPTQVFVHNLLIDPDRGFNKNRNYLIWVGQIIGKRNKVYARGEVALKK